MAGGGRRRPGRGRRPTWRFLSERSRECLGGGGHHGRVMVAHVCRTSAIVAVAVVVVVVVVEGGGGGGACGAVAVDAVVMSIVDACRYSLVWRLYFVEDLIQRRRWGDSAAGPRTGKRRG